MAARGDKDRDVAEISAFLQATAKTDAGKADKGPGAACGGCPYKNRENLLRMLGEQT